jgi:predicted type IV restriction endonuclease
MEKLISQLRDRFSSAQYRNEQAIRETVVLPILQELGWKIWDPTTVVREYKLGPERVDYALTSTPPQMQVFIEVKAPGQSVGADRQLFQYAFHAGIPFAVLTDGKEWNFFLPGEQGSYEERRVQKLDILERSPSDAVEIFKRYLSEDRVRNGAAFQDARADYKNIFKRRQAGQEIPRAWNELVSEPDELLIDLLAEKTESLCGFRPAPEDVEQFLALLPQPSTPRVSPAPVPIVPPKPIRGVDEFKLVSERNIDYKIFGQNRQAPNATAALVDILQTLAQRDINFLGKLAPLVQGRSRNHIARTREH